jgi:hypothetical protein
LSIYIGVVSTCHNLSGRESLSVFRETEGFRVLKVSVFSQQAPCDNSLAVSCGSGFIKRTLTLTFAKAFTFVANAHTWCPDIY